MNHLNTPVKMAHAIIWSKIVTRLLQIVLDQK
jgi:hypothetical protein